MKRDKITKGQIILRVTALTVLLCLCLGLYSCSEGDEAYSEKQFDENGIFVSEGMSYDELKDYYSRDKDISLNDAEGKLAQMDITGEEESTYRVAVKKVKSSDKYTPYIEFYLETSEAEDSWVMEKIRKAGVYATKDQKEAVFLGTLACWLREDNVIEYSLYGDIFDTAAIKGSVVCEDESDEDATVLHYLIDTEVKSKDGEEVYVHEFIGL